MVDDPENFYDREIAPLLKQAATKCEEAGMSITCVVEYAPGDVGMTLLKRADAGIQMRLAWFGAMARGNADALIGALIADGERHGHNSIYLDLLTKER